MKALSLQSTPPSPPVHVAIIMDGNGRWAQLRGLKRAAGHKAGAATVKRIIKYAIKAGVGYLTLYGFSLENWKRSSGEINDLMGLLRFYLRSEIASLHKNGIRFRVIGDRQRLDRDIVALIDEAERITAGNATLNLTVALSYGGRAEIARAARPRAERAKVGRDDLVIVIPAVVVTELLEAFALGFAIYLPFLIIDLVVSNVLLALGMQMMSPTQVSLPFKLLLFVAIDGWGLLAQALVTGYRIG